MIFLIESGEQLNNLLIPKGTSPHPAEPGLDCQKSMGTTPLFGPPSAYLYGCGMIPVEVFHSIAPHATPSKNFRRAILKSIPPRLCYIAFKGQKGEIMGKTEIQKLEQELFDKYRQLTKLRRDSAPEEVKNYPFKTIEGESSLLELFGDKDTLFVIHNMGQDCPYCTLWADGLNAFLPHLEQRFGVVLVSKDEPQVQRTMANDRGWRYRMASHGGGDYIKEQSVADSEESESSANYPGIVCYERKGDKIFRKNRSAFGPGDEYCSLWNIISLAGHDEESWGPQFSYWKQS